MCNPHEKQGKQKLRMLLTFSRVCRPSFDDPKGRWKESGMFFFSKIFFIIIHLLYADACVVVSNLLEFLHKSNPSSCLAAIVS